MVDEYLNGLIHTIIEGQMLIFLIIQNQFLFDWD